MRQIYRFRSLIALSLQMLIVVAVLTACGQSTSASQPSAATATEQPSA
ncbi:MAG: hypothetical protein HGA19_21000, partial [Oscillochloris sp.]|nr:hypothetical protein [Oscillochloris sp.]